MACGRNGNYVRQMFGEQKIVCEAEKHNADSEMDRLFFWINFPLWLRMKLNLKKYYLWNKLDNTFFNSCIPTVT